jgi:hypothetical protein
MQVVELKESISLVPGIVTRLRADVGGQSQKLHHRLVRYVITASVAL